MVMDETNKNVKARIDAYERNLQAQKEIQDRNLDIDIAVLRVLRDVNPQFANWLVVNAESQQKSPRELLNEVLILALQTKH